MWVEVILEKSNDHVTRGPAIERPRTAARLLWRRAPIHSWLLFVHVCVSWGGPLFLSHPEVFVHTNGFHGVPERIRAGSNELLKSTPHGSCGRQGAAEDQSEVCGKAPVSCVPQVQHESNGTSGQCPPARPWHSLNLYAVRTHSLAERIPAIELGASPLRLG